ncbi:ABC transporter, partial [Streptomyces tendae]
MEAEETRESGVAGESRVAGESGVAQEESGVAADPAADPAEDPAADPISLRGATATLGGRPVLRGIDLTVRRSEVVA